ncbi:TolC family protein [Aureitalea sp. L0-47]|uniref:TolC family protein n=1 Tax=Aureitalea sp. L0-47 TaxID=2816962 RepID=UPI0022376F79|nr:TolC family protein [Aureitalea sp. L0-47]MCW5518746.1 TolC family protein [Aureitalea sp. L0-47]
MRKFLFYIVAVILMFSGRSFGQEDMVELLDKEDAIALMLENNFSVQIARNNVNIAENNAGILNSGYLPTLFGLAGGNYDNTTSTTDFNGALDNQGNPRPDITIEDAETRALNASINLDYTLFDGLGRLYNYKSLKEQYQLSELQARQTIEETAVQLLVVYYDVARLKENVAVLETALEISKEREVRAQYQFDYGQVRKLDLLNARVDVNTDSINLLNARQQLLNAKRDLNLLLNRDLETTFRVDTTVTFVNELELESYVASVEENNVRLLQAEKNLEITDYTLKRNRGLLLPTVGLSGSYGWNRSENPASAFFPGTIRTSASLNVGLNLRWNLFDGGNAYTTIRNSKIAIENQELVKSQFQQEVYRDLANAKGDYDNALYIYGLQEQNVLTNKDNFERSREQLKLGQISSLEFRQAQINLLNAQTTRNAAKYNAKAAEARLLQLVGQLLNVPF